MIPRRMRLVLGLLLGIAFLAGVLSLRAQNTQTRKAEPRPQNQRSFQGRKIFESICATCHGLDGRGGERGPDIIAKQEVLRLSDADTLEILEKGVPAGMPSFHSLGKAKLKAVLNYLRTLQGRGNTAILPGDPQRGQVLFFGKPRCSECHMIHGKGGFLGDDLSKYGLTVPPAEIRSAIAAPGEDPDPRQRTASVTTRNGQKYTGIVRNEDNFSLQLQSSDGAFHLLLKSDLEHLEFLPTPVMPPDYGSTLSAAELDDLVAYLVNVARTGRSANPAGSKPHEEDDD